MCLLLLQALLILTHKTKLHRATGWLGIALASAVVVLGIYGSLIAAQRPVGFIGVPLPPSLTGGGPWGLGFGVNIGCILVCR